MRKIVFNSIFLAAVLVSGSSVLGADVGPAAWWKFDEGKGATTTDSVSGAADVVGGNFKFVDGVRGNAIRFDGYTTHVTRSTGNAPRLTDAFTIEAWAAMQTYPWNWTALVDQAGDEKEKDDEKGLTAGLFGARFGGPTFRGPEGTDVLPEVNGDWTGMLGDWSARWRGYIVGPVTGEVIFLAEADNGLKLEIGNKMVIDGWGRDKSRLGKMAMVKGQAYPVVLSYYQDGGPSFLRVYWSWAGQGKKIVGGDLLKHSDADEVYVKTQELGRKLPAKERKSRMFFGVDAEGHIGLKMGVNGEARQCISEAKLPLLKWSHVAATFDKARGMRLYINGKDVGQLAVEGVVTPASGYKVVIGRSNEKMYPVNTERVPSRKLLSNMVFDGLIDEVKIYHRALAAEEVRQAYTSSKPAREQPLEYRVMPSGSKDMEPYFGAIYGRLNYAETWEKLWRVGEDPDILVVFDELPIRTAFWRGTNYGAGWVAENGLWMGDQSLECGSEWGCAEHMSDKQCRYSHVRIIENHDARVVVHWRYSPVDITYAISDMNPIFAGKFLRKCVSQ